MCEYKMQKQHTCPNLTSIMFKIHFVNMQILQIPLFVAATWNCYGKTDPL